MIVKLYRLSIIWFLLLSLISFPAISSPHNEVSPGLLLLIVVDQMRADYLDRFQAHFRFGLKRLLEDSVRFEQAYHDHAGTSTGSGHSSISSGRYPRNSGIVGNSWYDRKSGSAMNCVQDDRVTTLDSPLPGRSPRNMLVSSLGDWIQASDSNARVFGASRKDRSAILLAGREADAAFWYDGYGRFVSSSYYFSSLPDWLVEFNNKSWPEQFFGTLWELRPGRTQQLKKLDIKDLNNGIFLDHMPRAYGSTSLQPNSAFYTGVGNSPRMDEYLGLLAAELIEHEELGQRESLDMLALGFSALDSVGHAFGPNSPELFDTLMHLDWVLGSLLERIDERVGLEKTLIILSSDHGVIPVPEDPALRDQGARRFNQQDILCYQKAGMALQQALGEGEWFEVDLYLNYETIGARNILRSEVEKQAARLLAGCESVERVWTRTELEGPAPSDPLGRLYWNSFNSDRSPDLMVQLKPWRLAIRGRGTSHGSPYPYDRHVPLLMRLPGVISSAVAEQVRTIDISPTIADWLGIPFPQDLDGRSLRSLIRLTPVPDRP